MLYRRYKSIIIVVFVFLFVGRFCFAELDKNKYIGVSEIKAGMRGYCLTCLKGTEADKFELEVLSIIHNFNPARDTILVKCEGSQFEHAGVIAGCSGTPVYIDGRLAGAMSFGWLGSKDPIYGVTPIEDMLRAGKSESYQNLQEIETGAIPFDFSRPLSFVEVDNQFKSFLEAKRDSASGMQPLPMPLFVSGLPASAIKELNSIFEPLSLMPVVGLGGSAAVEDKKAPASVFRQEGAAAKLVPGSSLVIPLVYGDITIAAGGTVTEVVGDKVYGFGHSLLGYGPVDLPMATGQVHTIIANQFRSFKLISPLQVVGALKVDESTAVCGKIGAEASMFDMTVEVNRYNDTQPRKFRCRVVNHKILTPRLISLLIIGAATFLGDLPPEYNIEYSASIAYGGAGQATIVAEEAEPIKFENISSETAISDLTSDVSGAVGLLMNNPFKTVEIKSIDVRIKIAPKDISAHIWSVQVSDTKVKAGATVDVDVVLETVREPKKSYNFKVKLPENLPAGRYELAVCGTAEYTRFLNQAAPYRFIAQSFESLVEAMKELLIVKRYQLYCLLILPASGIVVEKAELSDLPATKAVILYDAKRSLSTQPHQNWRESSIKTGLLTIDRRNIQITVED
jgi:hypothetical protein